MLVTEKTVESPTGNLELGFVGDTNYIFLRFIGKTQGKAIVVYSPSEFSSLTNLFKDAAKLARVSKPGSTLTLGVMRPKPTVVSASLIHPDSSSPFVMLLFQHREQTLEVPLPLDETSKLSLQGKTRGTPTCAGRLELARDGSWILVGEYLTVASHFCAGTGPYGEYMSPTEVSNNDELTAIVATIGGAKQVIAFYTQKQWQPPETIEVAVAQEGDLALAAGLTYRCRFLHKRFISQITNPADIPPTWAAKLALSQLLCDIYERDDENGYAIWSGQTEDPVMKLGVASLEKASASFQDQLIFQLISAYYHSLGADQSQAYEAVNSIMQELFSAAKQHQPDMQRLILNNWALMLKDIFSGSPPSQAIESWKSCKSTYPGKVAPKALCFPIPDVWHPAPLQTESIGEQGEIENESIPASQLTHNIEKATTDAESPPPQHIEQEEPSRTPLVADKKGRKKSLPKTLAGLLFFLGVIGLGLYFTLRKSDASNHAAQQASPPVLAQETATPSLDTATPEATASSPEEGEASATPTSEEEPKEDPDPSASGVETSQPSAAAGATAAGADQIPSATGTPIDLAINEKDKLSLSDLDPNEKYFVDRGILGWQTIEEGDGWAKYEKDGVQLILGAKPTSTLKSTRVRSFASSTLYSNGKKLFDASTAAGRLTAAAESSLKLSGIAPIYSPGMHKLLGFKQGDPFPDDTPAPGQAASSSILTSFQKNDLKGFQAALTPAAANLVFMDGSTILDRVANKAGSIEYCKALIKAGAIVKGDPGSQALWSTLDPDIASLLIAEGASVDHVGPSGQTKLFGANKEMLKVLLQAKSNPNFQDASGDTPLLAATGSEAIGLLLKAGADPNLSNGVGKTALMGKDLASTKLLLAAGANPNLKDSSGKTALDYANGDAAIINLLKKAASSAPVQK